MGDDNEPIEGSPVDTAADIAAPAPGYGHDPTTTFTTTSTTTSTPSITTSKAASTTTGPILTPAVKPPKKQARVNTVKKDPVAAGCHGTHSFSRLCASLTFLTRAHVRPETPTHVPLQPLFIPVPGTRRLFFFIQCLCINHA